MNTKRHPTRRRPPSVNRTTRRPSRRRTATTALLLVTLLAAEFSFVGCEREERTFRVPPPAISRDPGVRLSELQPGPHAAPAPWKSRYDENAYAQSQGQQLFEAFNCVGCHSHGGGNEGPPLLDEKWRYGSSADQVYLSIMQGRPNGMPSFRGKLNELHAWEIVAYVRSLSGLTPATTASGREDHMKANSPPNSVTPLNAVMAAAPHPGD